MKGVGNGIKGETGTPTTRPPPPPRRGGGREGGGERRERREEKIPAVEFPRAVRWFFLPRPAGPQRIPLLLWRGRARDGTNWAAKAWRVSGPGGMISLRD